MRTRRRGNDAGRSGTWLWTGDGEPDVAARTAGRVKARPRCSRGFGALPLVGTSDSAATYARSGAAAHRLRLHLLDSHAESQPCHWNIAQSIAPEAPSSILALGTRRLAEAGQQATIRLVREAIDHGVTLIEVAPGYGDGRTERWIGLALRDGYREKVRTPLAVLRVPSRLQDGDAAVRGHARAPAHRSPRLLVVPRGDLRQRSRLDVRPWRARRGGRGARPGAAALDRLPREKSPHIALKLIAKGFAWDIVLMPLNPFDATFRSFEKQVLPEVIRRGGTVIGTKPMAGGAIPAAQGDQARRRAALRLVAAGELGARRLRLTPRRCARRPSAPRQFTPYHAGEMDALRQKARITAGDGRYERYKTTQEFDSAGGKSAHGYP